MFFCFFYPLLLWVFLVCFTCYALLHIRGHSHSPPLIRHYVSYLISPFAEITPGHMTPTRECTHLTNPVTSQCELVTIFFQAWEANRHIFTDSVWVGDTEKHLTKISSRAGVEPRTFRSWALRFTARLCPLNCYRRYVCYRRVAQYLNTRLWQVFALVEFCSI